MSNHFCAFFSNADSASIRCPGSVRSTQQPTTKHHPGSKTGSTSNHHQLSRSNRGDRNSKSGDVCVTSWKNSCPLKLLLKHFFSFFLQLLSQQALPVAAASSTRAISGLQSLIATSLSQQPASIAPAVRTLIVHMPLHHDINNYTLLTCVNSQLCFSV